MQLTWFELGAARTERQSTACPSALASLHQRGARATLASLV